MRVNLVRVGNSKGVIIPATLIASCGLKEAVNLQIEGKKLVIEALAQPRAGWFDTAPDTAPDDAATPDESVLDSIPLEEGDDEWVW